MRVSYLPVLVLLIDKFVLQIIICGTWAASEKAYVRPQNGR